MIKVIYRDEEQSFEDGLTGRELLKRLGLTEEEALLVSGGKLLPLNEELPREGVKVIPVLSGG